MKPLLSRCTKLIALLILCFLYLQFSQTSKRKFFVLKVASRLGKARLEYFDSEKKFATHQSVKKTILISECFEISKIEDKKYDYVFALFTKDEKLSLIADSAEERQEWLQALSDARKDSKRHGELLVYGKQFV